MRRIHRNLYGKVLIVAGVWMTLAVSMRAQQSLADVLRSATMTNGSAPLSDTVGLPQPPSTLEDALHSLYTSADVIFTGEVTSVERSDETVTVRFQVLEGIRGVSDGATYVLREWAGLWVDDPSRYVVKEQRLMLLRANSACGYASPAGGVGAFTLHGDSAQGSVDLRWLAVQVPASTQNTVQPAAQSFAVVESTVKRDVSQMDRAMVTSMLRAWHRMEVTQ
ncbi:hypothetical protein [Terriglobus roseus]|uniref:Uncharacterized protein n=1 Tax=Terriglobus roseus TaxID=392734 RepID=A0A1G7R2P6_9BACT|nr:hypothetical protein [Terriglobus roseus]SDG04984.1 hypothetical protein SAMN05444167_4100 [Terriglobus roseus]